MADLQKIISIVKSMRDAGIPDENIREDLRKMALKDEEIEAVFEAVSPAPEAGVGEGGVEGALADLKAEVAALKSVCVKILETNREILLKLKK